jgi:hypothetical protein
VPQSQAADHFAFVGGQAHLSYVSKHHMARANPGVGGSSSAGPGAHACAP